LYAETQRLGLAATSDGADYVFLVLSLLYGYRGQSHVLEPLLAAGQRSAPFALERADRAAAAEHFALLRQSGLTLDRVGERVALRAETRLRVADVCAELGTAEDARLAYAQLAPYAGGYVVEGGLVCFGAADRALGELALCSEQVALALEHLTRALELNRRMGHRPEVVRTQLALTRALARAGRGAEARSGWTA